MRIIILFLMSLLMTTMSFSQSTSTHITRDSMVLITPQQLKTANLIFLEHEMLSKENEVLESQINALKYLYYDELRIDSLYESMIKDLNIAIDVRDKDINEQEKHIKRAKRWINVWRTVGCSTSLALLLVCLL